MLKEQVALKEKLFPIVCSVLCVECLGSKCPYIQGDWVNGRVNKILNLFKAEVDKLTVIADGEIFKACGEDYIGGEEMDWCCEAVKAQLQHTKKQLLEGLEEG